MDRTVRLKKRGVQVGSGRLNHSPRRRRATEIKGFKMQHFKMLGFGMLGVVLLLSILRF